VPLGEDQASSAVDRRAYWEQRLRAEFSLDGVGYAGLGRSFNEQMYRVRRHVFLRLARPLVAATPGASVLDAGSGTGFYVERWQELGVARITGSDVTETAVAELSRRHPEHAFVEMDVTADRLPLQPESFDLVSAIDMLFHILDEDAHARAIANLARLTRPGGHVILSENLYRTAPPPAAHQVGRDERTILRRLADAGLQLERRAPMFVLLNRPVRSGSRLHAAAWARLAATAKRRPGLGAGVARSLYPVETLLVDRVKDAPSTEFLVCRRP
jgi:2-polyprenyl-3-methyl-5-hydroxy-6-metoxy-1,4-benzoquinol methylase